jgi:predicted transcriptional regulator
MIMLDQRLFLQVRGNRRDRLVILSAMLSYAAKGVCKTELMYKVGLSSAQLDRYIPVLVRSELLKVFNHTKKALYQTTDKGRSFLDIFDTLVSLLD